MRPSQTSTPQTAASNRAVWLSLGFITLLAFVCSFTGIVSAIQDAPGALSFSQPVFNVNEGDGNFVDAEMVKAFINSGEYRGRFGQ